MLSRSPRAKWLSASLTANKKACYKTELPFLATFASKSSMLINAAHGRRHLPSRPLSSRFITTNGPVRAFTLSATNVRKMIVTADSKRSGSFRVSY